MRDIGDRIAVARRSLGLTQAELAEKLGVPLGILDKYESGRRDPYGHLDELAAVTGRPVAWFLTGVDDSEVRQLYQNLVSRIDALVERVDELQTDVSTLLRQGEEAHTPAAIRSRPRTARRLLPR